MKLQNIVRANQFDQWVGELQTLKSLQLGVGESLLDIGCGIGQFTPLFCRKFKQVVGLDPDERCLKVARLGNQKPTYVQGYGETFKFTQKFDTINMTNLLEHVDNPVKLLKNCKKHLNKGGRIIAQVPNANSITRRLGVIMGVIDSIKNISDREINVYGHQRVYTIKSLVKDFEKAGLKPVVTGGLLYKPLPNEILGEICKKRGDKWRRSFMDTLVKFGEDKTEDCAQIYVSARNN